MSGSTPFTARSPTQSNHYPPYSPSHSNRPHYLHDPYQLPPPPPPPPSAQQLAQTPPPFQPASLVHSPHHARPPPLASPLPPPNKTLPPLSGASSSYQPIMSSPPYQLQRTYSGRLVPGPMPSALDGSGGVHGHPVDRVGPLLPSPVGEHRPVSNGVLQQDVSHTRTTSQDKPDRTSNPMSFASILGPSNGDSAPKPAESISTWKPSTPLQIPATMAKEEESSPVENKPTHRKSSSKVIEDANKPVVEQIKKQKENVKPLKPRKALTTEETEKVTRALIELEDMANSDVDEAGFEEQKAAYRQRSNKRALAVTEEENSKRKRRRTHFLDTQINNIGRFALLGAERFRERFEPLAAKEINDKDVMDEKERKKDMQRKRRREQQLRNEELKRVEAHQKLQEAEDPQDIERYQRQMERSEARIKHTTTLLEGRPVEDEADISLLSAPLEAGMTSTLQFGSPEPEQPPKKRAKPSTGASSRPKKSKEKKRAEIESAQNAWAAMEEKKEIELQEEQRRKLQPLPEIAPKEEPRRESIKTKKAKEQSGAVMHTVNYDSKGYQQIYEQIWRDMARKDIPRVFRVKQSSLSTRQENMRKTAILASKQARKWEERTNKSMKDTQARAKRVMREMMSFWKRNEREERDLRRLAERKEIEDAKKAEADREANRQKRKLNFLISQTELYSHFIGRKIKTDEIEQSTNDPDVATSLQKVRPGDANAHTVDLPPSVADMTGRTKVTNFEDLDFDAEDDTALREAAMANAQSAVQDAQDRARAFDGDDQMAAFDDSDLNFQNPTMAGDVEVSQPNMLQAQLKEYQLKGLNWLVNLYEQGINGILADEMGLGKTIQAISVMGYLAERHNVWGPFLVIAPASTLHNWQQEITRFVPNIKVLPYWGNAKDRKVLRKFWDRKHITYNQDSEFHVLVTSYQLVVVDAQYFQKIKWQYMVLDEAQAIKSSQSSRWKTLLGFSCRNRLLLTGTPIQNNMQELWALLHFIMPTLFDSHDEFSDWFSKDIESHAQSNTKLNQDQLRRLHMILKPFMLRRVKAHVQKELGDKVEKDVFCDLTYRQRAYYMNLRSKISIMDLIEKATLGDDQDAATLMNLVMQFRKVCNHPDLFERADTTSPFAMSHYAETASFLREGSFVLIGYSVRNLIQYDLPRILCNDTGRLDIAGPNNDKAGFVKAGFRTGPLGDLLNVWSPQNIKRSSNGNGAFSWMRFADVSIGEVSNSASNDMLSRVITLRRKSRRVFDVFEEPTENVLPPHAMLNIVQNNPRRALAELDPNSRMGQLFNISKTTLDEQGYHVLEPASRPKVVAPPIEISAFDQSSITERHRTMFNPTIRNALYPVDINMDDYLLEKDVDPASFPDAGLLPPPASVKARYTNIAVPSMRRFVTDSGKLAKLDQLLGQLKAGGHRVLLYFQMTRMIDLMEEYLTYRNYKFVRLDGSTKLEDRRDTVHDFQTRPEIFIFLLSTRAGGLGINLTSADTVIFYDSDWNPTIDSQAMDRAHRLGQTKQVTVYRLITRGTIEERIRKRAMQKEEVQRVVITGGEGGAGVDFNTRDRRENRTKDIAMWLADEDQAALIEQKEKEAADKPEPEKKLSKKAQAAAAAKKRRGEMSMDDLYHEGEGNFEDAAKASGAATPNEVEETPAPQKGPRGGMGKSKKAKTAAQRLAIIDAAGDLGMSGS